MKYIKELSTKIGKDRDHVIKELPMKKTGRALILGELIDKQVQEYLKKLRANGSVKNTSIVKNHDSNLTQINGGHISLTKNWAKYLIKRMGFVK